MRRFGPRPRQLRLDVRSRGPHHQRVGRPQRREARALPIGVAGDGRRLHREHHHPFGRPQRALREEVEGANLGHIVAPEFQADRRRHAEAIDVHDAAPHRVLRNILHEWHAREPHAVEVRHEIGDAQRRAARNLEARFGQGARQPRAFHGGARRGDEHAHGAAGEPVE
jgi:hypothetical protein